MFFFFFASPFGQQHEFASDEMFLSNLCLCAVFFSRSPLQDNWEIVEGLRGAPAVMQQPEPKHGFLLKRRKWPMKGWHKVSTS